MSGVFLLASEFIDRMANPAYGLKENEEYSLRFISLNRSEGFESEGFEEIFRSEAERLRDPNTLTSYGWLWLLNWARSNGVTLNGDLLLDLVQRWPSTALQALAIEVAIKAYQTDMPDEAYSMGLVDLPWINRLLAVCTEPPKISDDTTRRAEDDLWRSGDEDEVSGFKDEFGPDTQLAESILLALIQVGSEPALGAAKALLQRQWPGQAKLLEFFGFQLALLDPETRELWLQRLEPPEGYRRFE